MSQRRLTHVIVPRYPLTDFIFDGLRGREDIRLIEHPMPPRGKFGSFIRFLEVSALPWWRGSFYFDKSYIATLSNIAAQDRVLFFAVENRKDLQIVRKFIAARRQFVWLWNPIESFRGHRLSRLFYRYWLGRAGIEAFTFNPADARENGISLISQVYRSVEGFEAADTAGKPLAHDVYFLGLDKGRLQALQSLKIEMERLGLTTHFRILSDKRRQYSDVERGQLASEWLPYADNLRMVRDSRVLLELLQSTQDGPSIRSMEAAFFNRKLITNNRGMRQSPLYHPSRIFILGEDDLADLKAFVDSRLVPVDPAVLRGHDIEHWIRQFGS